MSMQEQDDLINVIKSELDDTNKEDAKACVSVVYASILAGRKLEVIRMALKLTSVFLDGYNDAYKEQFLNQAGITKDLMAEYSKKDLRV